MPTAQGRQATHRLLEGLERTARQLPPQAKQVQAAPAREVSSLPTAAATAESSARPEGGRSGCRPAMAD